MLNTIKSKIIFLTIAILIILSGVLSFYTFANYKAISFLLTKSCNFTVSTISERINKEIIALENNAIDLAIVGKFFYNTSKSQKNLDKYVLESFGNNRYSVGGGLWYEPYVIIPSQKEFYTFVYPNDTGKMRVYNLYNGYLTQNWYKEISTKSHNLSAVWSTPYFDSEGSKIIMVTVGASIVDDKTKKVVGVSSVDWELNSIVNTISQMRPTDNSFALFADKKNDFVIINTDNATKHTDLGKSLKTISWYNDNLEDVNVIQYNNKTYISYVKNLDNGMILIVNVPQDELFYKLNNYVIHIIIILFLVSIIIAGGIFWVLRRYINKPIDKLTDIANKISSGDLDAEIKLEKPKEFADLAATFNNMTNDIKEYMSNLNAVTKEKEKIESELSIAKTIQCSVLPSDFYDNAFEFDIFATMETAKEVGGDFFDFFYITPSKFLLLIADVSGKGIPAALFMMTTKTLIKNIALENLSPKEFIEKANKAIYENNKQNYFVTMFAAIVDINTGKISFINCGHNPPLIKHKDGSYEYLKINSNLVLGVAPNFIFNIEETILQENDIIFLYTDGVTEALNENQELYGEERLVDYLNSSENENVFNVNNIISNVKKNLKAYTGSTEQSDDITMLAFKYNGSSIRTVQDSIVLPAKIDKYQTFNIWFEDICERFNIGRADMMRLALVSEELFVNVASYAYPDSEGNIEIIVSNSPQEIMMQFTDSGIPYNPLQKADPDINLGLDDRPIGGLGIFMVKKSVDFINYEYKNNQNILTISILRK